MTLPPAPDPAATTTTPPAPPPDGTGPAATQPPAGAPPAPDPAATPPAPAVADEPLGEAGLKALQAERAQRQALEKQIKELQPLAEQAQQLADANKSDIEKATETAAAAQAELAATARGMSQLTAALAKAPPGTDPAVILDLAGRLRGETPDELQTDAEVLFSRMTPAAGATPPAVAPSGLPVEALQPGAMPAPANAPTLDQQIAAATAAGDRTLAMQLKAAKLVQLQQQQKQ